MGCDFATEILGSEVVDHYILRDSTDIQVRILARTSVTGYTVAGVAVRTVAEAVAVHSIPAGMMANSFLAEVEDRSSNTLAGVVGVHNIHVGVDIVGVHILRTDLLTCPWICLSCCFCSSGMHRS